MAGVGKSALAIHAAHLVGDQFPDAQLYANLRKTDGSPVDATTVLATFLRALGLEGEDQAIPDDADGRERLYRSLLSRRRVLVVLDNVDSATQIHPLLNVGRGCALIVTSRQALSALEGAYSIELSALPAPRALELLRHMAGIERGRKEIAAARGIPALCGLLPLPLRVAGRALAIRDYWSLAHDAERLADERERLNRLQDEHVDISASVWLSYAELQATMPMAARLFRLLGVLVGQDFCVAAAAALLDRPQHEAESTLERLVHAQLVEPASHRGRYRLHDLLRTFARARLKEEEAAEVQQTARLRLARWYVTVAPVADAVLWLDTRRKLAAQLARANGDSQSNFERELVRAALAWFDGEREDLLAVLQAAREAQESDLESCLTGNLVTYLHMRS